MSKQTAPDNAWSVPIAVADIPETGRRIDLVADEATRDAIAKVAGVVAVPRLEASFDLTRHGKDGLRLVGRLLATVGQNCVVTLAPMENQVDEAIDLVFMSEPEAHAAAVKTERPRAPHADEVDDAPEVLRNGAVDLGAIAIEFLMLGIEPYPRKPGAVFDAAPVDDPASHPFAALAALRKDDGANDR